MFVLWPLRPLKHRGFHVNYQGPYLLLCDWWKGCQDQLHSSYFYSWFLIRYSLFVIRCVFLSVLLNFITHLIICYAISITSITPPKRQQRHQWQKGKKRIKTTTITTRNTNHRTHTIFHKWFKVGFLSTHLLLIFHGINFVTFSCPSNTINHILRVPFCPWHCTLILYITSTFTPWYLNIVFDLTLLELTWLDLIWLD